MIKKILKWTLIVLALLYVIPCIILYWNQEKIIFHPRKLDNQYTFQFTQEFEEKRITTPDGTTLHGILFKADNSKGLIFYLHGNAGSLDSWGTVAGFYTERQYDVFMLDYRGYGKSEGSISSEDQFYEDIQVAYNGLKKSYSESKIIILGYSIGTGPAAHLAIANHPRLLILQAPYYSLTDMMKNRFSFVPAFLLKYKFETYRYLQESNIPVIIFHGDRDEVIPHASSIRLMDILKKRGALITLPGQGHNGMTGHPLYRFEINNILEGKFLDVNNNPV